MNFRIVDVVPNSPEHFAFRRGKIGASMAPDIMGIGFNTPLQLWEKMIFDREEEGSSAMKRGVRLEPVARDWINARTGKNYGMAVIQSTENPALIASLDGYYEENG